MKQLGLLLCLIIASMDLTGLNVTANPTQLLAGNNNVSFTFDCNFSGSVLVNNPPNGISFPGATGPTYILNVSNGVIAFDINVDCTGSSNIPISFVVLSSNMGCASSNDSASHTFTNVCVGPPNDNCADSTTLGISSNSCSPVSFSTTNGQPSNSIPSCAVAGYHSLWYNFTANNNTVTVELNSVPGTVGFYGLYNSCGGSDVACDIIIPSSSNMFDLNNLNVGNTYYLQILFLPSNAGMNQEICLYATSNCLTDITVSSNGPNLPNTSYTAQQTISTTGNCSLMNNGVIFDGGQAIELNAGFYTNSKSFEAKINGCNP